VQHTKTGEKYTKLPRNIPNVHLTYQMAVKLRPTVHKIYQHLLLQVPRKITQNLDFWFENIPSGNPGQTV
jgi:hypothetical protein